MSMYLITYPAQLRGLYISPELAQVEPAVAAYFRVFRSARLSQLGHSGVWPQFAAV